MVPALPMMLAALLAQTGSSMSDEALADRLIAALPDSEAVYAVDRTADPVELAQLEAANPGRTEEIRPILENHAACEAAMRIAMTRRGLSRLVAQMGAEKVGRLIAFYEGEDFGRFAALTTRLEQGEGLSTDEQDELDRIGAAYPVYEFAERMQTDLPSAMADAATFDAMSRCSDEKAAALERLGLQLSPEDVSDDSADPVPAEESPS